MDAPWFIEGAFRPEGFDTDFQAHAKVLEDCTSLAVARAWFEKAMAAASATLSSKSDAELMTPIADGPSMGGAPRMAIVNGITDHTAHHRGPAGCRGERDGAECGGRDRVGSCASE